MTPSAKATEWSIAEHPGVVRARQYMDAFHAWDVEALRDFYDDDVLWHVAGNHQLSGDYRGKDALFDYFRLARQLTGGSLHLEPESILASDRHIAMFIRVTGRRNDRALDVLLAQVMKVGPDQRWTEYWAVADDQDAVDAFWA